MKYKNYLFLLLLMPLLSLSKCKRGANQQTKAQEKIAHDSAELAARPNTAPLKNMFGVDAYEWNFLQNPDKPADVSKIIDSKMALIKGFTAVRHYMDWEKIESAQGKYTFNPTHSGSWNYDLVYQQAAKDSVLMLADLKTCPKWFLQAYYPADMRDDENVPAPNGSDRTAPASYILQAKAAFQLAARYGSNKAVDPSLVMVDPSTRWNGDPANTVKIGMNLIKYIECDNERDKWWKGAKAQQNPQEYAANMSAFYDGDKGKLGKNVGVKNADPNIQVVMGGLAKPNVQYVKDMIAWCKAHRGYRADGSIDLCFDIINYHFYCNDEDKANNVANTTGTAPELTDAAAVADGFVKLANSLPGKPKVWITETGYDISPTSTQRAEPVGAKSALLTQADWSLRTCLLFARHGINRAFFYQLYDNSTHGNGIYQTTGLVNENLTRRPAADYIVQVTKLLGNYTYNSTLKADPLVDKYILGKKVFYALVVPDQKDLKATYVLDLGTATAANVYTLISGADTAVKTLVKTVKGKLTLHITETPMFVQAQ